MLSLEIRLVPYAFMHFYKPPDGQYLMWRSIHVVSPMCIVTFSKPITMQGNVVSCRCVQRDVFICPISQELVSFWYKPCILIRYQNRAIASGTMKCDQEVQHSCASLSVLESVRLYQQRCKVQSRPIRVSKESQRLQGSQRNSWRVCFRLCIHIVICEQ